MYYTSIFAEVRVDHKDNTFKMSVPEVGVFDVSEADVYSASWWHIKGIDFGLRTWKLPMGSSQYEWQHMQIRRVEWFVISEL